MNRQHGFRHLHHFFRRDKSQDVRQARICRRVAVRAAHAAADSEVVADQSVALDDGDEAVIVRENIHVVDRRDGKGHFEFSGQIALAVKRVHELLVGRIVEIELNAVNPDGMIGRRFGGNCRARPAGNPQ